MPEPPAIIRYREPTTRLTRKNRNRNYQRDKYGIRIPSNKIEDYEPSIDEHIELQNINKDLAKITKARMIAAWANYYKNYAQAEAERAYYGTTVRQLNFRNIQANNGRNNANNGRNNGRNNGTRKNLSKMFE